jgi:outer membrane protein assembly factor BamB
MSSSPPSRHWQLRRWPLWLALGVAALGLGVVWLRTNRPSPQDELLEAHRRQQAASGSLSPLTLAAAGPLDCPGYRGQRRDGVVKGPPLSRDWKLHPPRVVWRQPVGGGYAAFAVVGNVAVTIEQRRDREAVVCYDTVTGRERWVYDYAASFRRGEDAGPRATPTIDSGDVFALGATGRLVCLDAVSGRLKWSKEILQNNSNLTWGMSGSPLVDDHVVVVNPGVQRSDSGGRAVIAYHRTTGGVVWQAGQTQAGYSSPMLATLAGQSQILLLDGEVLGGYDAATGAQLWQFPWNTQQGINVAQPVVLEGDRVFISSGYGVGCALVQVGTSDSRWTAEPVWETSAMHCKFTSPVAYQGFVYGLDEGILVCVDVQTGKRRWKEGRYGHGQMLRADDLLLIMAESGELVLVEATPQGHHELGRLQALEGKTWNTPILVDGRAYLRNDREMVCYDLRADQAIAARNVLQVKDTVAMRSGM